MKYVSRPQSSAEKDINIADIFGYKYQCLIYISKCNIDQSLPIMDEEFGDQW